MICSASPLSLTTPGIRPANDPSAREDIDASDKDDNEDDDDDAKRGRSALLASASRTIQNCKSNYQAYINTALIVDVEITSRDMSKYRAK